MADGPACCSVTHKMAPVRYRTLSVNTPTSSPGRVLTGTDTQAREQRGLERPGAARERLESAQTSRGTGGAARRSDAAERRRRGGGRLTVAGVCGVLWVCQRTGTGRHFVRLLLLLMRTSTAREARTHCRGTHRHAHSAPKILCVRDDHFRPAIRARL